MSRLNVLEQKPITERKAWELRVQERCTAFWEKSDEKKELLKSAREQIRIQRTLSVLPKGGKIADLGAGKGIVSYYLAENGSQVTALDAINLPFFSDEKVEFVKGTLPYLKFDDGCFDGVVMTDVIAEIDEHLHRLLLSEISRFLKKEGWAVLSTPLDLYSEDALSQFLALVKTEFEVVEKKVSYHRLHIQLAHFFSMPARFCKAIKEKNYRAEQLKKRTNLNKLWFYLNTLSFFYLIWKPISLLSHLIRKRIVKSKKFVLFCERVSEILWFDRAISHVIVLLKKNSFV